MAVTEKEEEEVVTPPLSCLLLQELCERETELNTDPPPSLEGVEEILGYKFKNPNLLEEAFTHSSIYYPMKPSPSNARLEYMGDSVLDLLISTELFFLYPDLSSGPLTRLRAANVDKEKLARVAVNHGLHRYIRHKASHIEEQIREFSEAILEYPIHSNGLVDTPKFLADIVESTIGAVFIDSNNSVDTVWKVFKGLLEPMISLQTLGMHPVTELLELCQKHHLKIQFVKDAWEENTTVDVFVEDQLVGTSTYGLKKEIAQNRAAKAALDNIKRKLVESNTTTIFDA
ncbi:hypothetical protein HHK36_023891 [Tetracentron sinense]|uniref:Uncharacterized protein n=1 Tax=Tetracentron sinense TaxID=13715 RepID=A0A834YPK9_TETSI|nr:hypothetical protein HHK36_023891 [Tetracentron sinense]